MMKNVKTYEATLSHLTRLNSSVNGNPRFEARFDTKHGAIYAVTQVDSMLGYSIQNFERKPVTVSIGLHYGKHTIDSLKGA